MHSQKMQAPFIMKLRTDMHSHALAFLRNGGKEGEGTFIEKDVGWKTTEEGENSYKWEVEMVIGEQESPQDQTFGGMVNVVH